MHTGRLQRPLHIRPNWRPSVLVCMQRSYSRSVVTRYRTTGRSSTPTLTSTRTWSLWWKIAGLKTREPGSTSTASPYSSQASANTSQCGLTLFFSHPWILHRNGCHFRMPNKSKFGILNELGCIFCLAVWYLSHIIFRIWHLIFYVWQQHSILASFWRKFDRAAVGMAFQSPYPSHTHRNPHGNPHGNPHTHGTRSKYSIACRPTIPHRQILAVC